MTDNNLDKTRREEIKNILKEITEENDKLKSRTDLFLSNLKNGDLKKLLDELKEKLGEDKERLSSGRN